MPHRIFPVDFASPPPPRPHPVNQITEKVDRLNSILVWRRVSGLGRSSLAHFSLSFKSGNKHTHTHRGES